jgi:hypothetical protein
MALCAAKLGDRQLLAKHLLNALAVAKTAQHKQQLYEISLRYGFIDLYNTQLRRWSGKVALSLGYDRHPVLLDINGGVGAPLANSDAMYLASEINLEYNPSRHAGFSANVSDIHYQSDTVFSKNNYRSIEVKPRLSLIGSSLQAQLYFGQSRSQLDEVNFFGVNTAGLLLGWTLSPRWQLKLAVHYKKYRSLDERYAYLSGSELDRRIGLRFLKPGFNMEWEIGRQSNDRDDYYEAGALSQSYSPTRRDGGLTLQWQLQPRLWLSSMLQYRVSDYPEVQNKPHNDQRWSASAGMLVPLSPVWSFHLNYQRFDNRSNVSDFVYDTYHVLTGMGYRF